MYYVYVLHSDTDRGLYIGFSSNLSERLKYHNAGMSQSTTSRRPLRLIYYEAYCMVEDAQGRERFLKSGAGRRFLDKQLKNYFAAFPRRSTA